MYKTLTWQESAVAEKESADKSPSIFPDESAAQSTKSRYHPNFKIILFFNLPYVMTTVILYWRFGVTDVAKLKWWASAVVNTIFVIKIVVYVVTMAIDCKMNDQYFKETALKEVKASW